MRISALIAGAALLVGISACTIINPQGAIENALNAISADTLLSEIKTLSSDDFEGRKPGSEGEQKTVAYMQDQFKKLGLKPGNPNGTYLQTVPLAGISSAPSATFDVGGKALPSEFRKDYIAVTQHYAPDVTVKDSDIVFVGYGVDAPEYNWDDYKGVDMTGKTLLMLVNDPQIPDPKDATKLDDNMFKGKAMTYYGRWTYKYEEGARKGAAAVMIVHETPMAGYPFSVVVDSWGGENFTILDNNVKTLPVQGWLTYDKAAELCKAAGLDLTALKQAALQRDFRPVPLPNARASFHIANKLRKIESHNVIGKLDGTDPSLQNQYVIYTAHWDHLGKDTSLQGDQIYNGAADNASGSAGLLEIARAYTKLFPRPKRSILFLSVTAEEQGLLGSEYYATHPLYPLKYTLADINMDGLNTWGKTKDMILIGLGASDLDDIATEVLKSHGRTVTPDAEPEKGFYYRSDHFEFAKQGVPALDPDSGMDYIGKPAGYGKEKRDYYTEHDYHKPSDEVKPDWDLSGAVDDLRVFFEIGNNIADRPYYPLWKPGAEFKATRDEMMKSNQAFVMALHSHILHNGEIHSASDTLLKAGQVGLLSGWGVFSTLRVREGVLFAFERHWARMLRDARLLSVPMPSDENEIERSLLQLVETNGRPDCTLRLIVLRNGGGMWAGPQTAGREFDVIALTADSKDWGPGVRLTVQANGRFAAGEFAAAKILSWGANLVWAERAQKQGFDEAILLNEHGRVAECTSANIFAVFGNDVFTPPVSDGCLPGITRDVLLHEVHVPGVRILERELTVRDLETADEVCITSTTRDLLPVREIAGQTLGDNGAVRERVTAAFREFMKEDIARRKRANSPVLV